MEGRLCVRIVVNNDVLQKARNNHRSVITVQFINQMYVRLRHRSLLTICVTSY